MKKIVLCFLLCISSLVLTSCSNFSFGTNINANNATTISQNQDSLYYKICVDMDNVANSLRGLDVLYYENYCITELSPIVGYNSYQNQAQNYGINNNGIGSELPASAVNLTNYDVNYSYEPKYITDSSMLDTTYLRAYIQSLQDLFLITNDITAGNEILNNLIYNTINEALNIKNNASITNMANLALTAEQNNIFNECSIGINSLITNLNNSSNFINLQLNSITNLRDNYHKNIEALNIKYITILNIIDNRIVQIKNLNELLTRLNNQLLILRGNNYINNSNFNSIDNYNNNNYQAQNLSNNYNNNHTSNQTTYNTNNPEQNINNSTNNNNSVNNQSNNYIQNAVPLTSENQSISTNEPSTNVYDI